MRENIFDVIQIRLAIVFHNLQKFTPEEGKCPLKDYKRQPIMGKISDAIL